MFYDLSNEDLEIRKLLAKAILKDSYNEVLLPYTHILKQVMQRNRLEKFEALKLISLSSHYKENATAKIMYAAAYLDFE